MRWFIEVSTVGSGDTDTEYCVEAKQWQAALQQARKLRGEAGPLSAFSIELLDSGYRAVDKKQNLKYVVRKAPNDAPLNDGKNGVTSSVAEATSRTTEAESSIEGGETSAPDASSEPPGHQVASSPRGSGPPPKPRLVSSRPPAEDAAGGPDTGKVKNSSPAAGKKGPQKVAELLAAAALKASTRPSGSSGTAAGRVGSGPANAARPGAGAALANVPILAQGAEAGTQTQPTGMPSSSALAFDDGPQNEPASEGDANALPSISGSVASTPEPGSAPTPLAQVDAELPDFEVIRSRGEEPSKETPITYREVALGVSPGVSKSATRALLWARYRSIANEIAERPKGKFVQVAVFDHVFGKKPLRPPLATLMWKDWRGEPVVAFPGFSGDSVQPPPPLGEPARGSLRPISVIPVDETTGSRPPPPKEEALATTEKGAFPDGENTSRAQTQNASSAQAGPDATSEQTAERAATAAQGSQPAVVPASASVGGGLGGTGVAAEELVPLRNKPARDSRPGLRRSGDPSSDDLILDLFERMHELHFMADVVNGSEFVLRVVRQTLPSAFALIQVFDINTKNFVVVRQYGGSAEKVLMYQTPDTDALVRKVMRASRTANVSEAETSVELGDGRWQAAGVAIGPLLLGPVKQGGRYLGLIEIANPAGGKAFTDTEANALDYICEQFAEFLTNRPIVLDADVILK